MTANHTPPATEPTTATEFIDATEEDWWVCPCGNQPDSYGFVTCLPTGESIEPYGNGPWDGKHSRCEDCGRVARQDQRDPATGRIPVLFTYPLPDQPRCDLVVARAGGYGACDATLPTDGRDCGSTQHAERDSAAGGPHFNA